MKKILLLAFAALLFASCADDNDDDNGIYYATSISISPSSVNTKVGRSLDYKVTVSPSYAPQSYTIKADNPDLITLDPEANKFKANASGTALIIVKPVSAAGHVADTLIVNIN